ncbi:MAG: FG-GAP repeat domain-containing protein, partial [Pirellulales bacterium]
MPQPHLGICRFAPISRGPAIDRTGRAVLLLISLTFVAAGCNNSPPPAPPVVPKIPAAKLPPGILPGSGHARMLHELDRIQSGERPNVFIKEIQHRRQLEEQLAGLPANASGAERVKLQMDLGQCELELGHEAEALEFMQAAQKTLKDLGVYMPPQEQVAMLYKLGVAYLRLGETENCCLRHTPESCFMPIRGQGVHTKKHGSTEAARCFTQLLAMEPEGTSFFVAAKWLLNVAHMTLGQFPDAVPEKYRIPPTVFESSVEFPHFNNIANEMGLETFDQAGGSISEDFDNDGYLEIVTSTESPSESMRLYRRNADGTFSEKTAQAMLKGIRGGRNMCQIDYDNDGDFDIYLSRGGWWGPDGMHPNSLLRNEGDGTFSDVTYESGLGERQLPTSTSSWADFDNDGDLDLFVANEAIRNGPPNLRDIACELFRNNGDGTFTNVAATAGVENFGFAKGAAWGDYNGDRLPDLYVANHQESNRLYRNLGQGRFEDVASDAHVRDPIQAFPCWFWDYNNDGNLDLMVHAYPTTVDLVASHYLGLPTTCDVPSLYRGDGQGNFEDVAEEVGITRPDMVMGCNF